MEGYNELYKESKYSDMLNNGMYMKDSFEIIDTECEDDNEKVEEEVYLKIVSDLPIETRRVLLYHMRFKCLLSAIFELYDLAGVYERELNALINDFKSRRPSGRMESFDEIKETERVGLILNKVNCRSLTNKNDRFLSADEIVERLHMEFDGLLERGLINEFLGYDNGKQGYNQNDVVLGMRRGKI